MELKKIPFYSFFFVIKELKRTVLELDQLREHRNYIDDVTLKIFSCFFFHFAFNYIQSLFIF